MDMKKIDLAAKVLVAIGGLNWLFYAFNYNLVEMLLGSVPMLESAVYVLVGLAAIYMLYGLIKK